MGLALASTAACAAIAFGCGPSFQAIYEGNARFEHCYALEENAQRPMTDKADCWRDWSEHYTYGQTRDRIHYATSRYVALSQSSNVPTDEAMMMAAPGMTTPRQSSITAPSPTNAFAPPPKVLDEYDAGVPPRPSEMPNVVGEGANAAPAWRPAPQPTAVSPLPGQSCSDDCGKKLSDCKDTCTSPDAGARASTAPKPTSTETCSSCEKTYKACMRACFK